MAISTQAIRYGWVALASLGVITGTTIYVASNARKQVKPEDIIEIALGVHERCLATQTATNPTYSVDPPSIVRTWTSNVYTTNGVTVYTNIVTNTIGWHTDRAMMVSLDTTIKALIPYYVDTNTVYDGTTNIVMLTVTGLWASLGIGDGTNQFTATPSWTNQTVTNWLINYTNYWPLTNAPTINSYTSTVQQTVNYAYGFTSNAFLWTNRLFTANEDVTTTNVATYGDYPWQIYVEDLQERYKVLEALKCVALPSAFDQDISYRRTGSVFDDFEPVRTWAGVETFLNMAITIPTTNYDQWYFDSDDLPVRTYYGNTRGSAYQWPGGNAVWTWGGSFGGSATGVVWRGRSQSLKMEITGPRLFNTNLTIIKSFCQQYIKEESLSNYGQDYYYGYGHNTFWGTPLPDPMREFLSYYSGDEVYTNDSARTVKQWPSNHVVLIDFPTPIFTDLSVITNTARFDYAIGARYTFNAPTSYLFPQFNYCTDAYWE